MPRMTDAELLAAIEAAESNALGPLTSEIAADRADAIDRYLGKPYGDEQAGRSQVVSRDVSDVVEGVTANTLKPFVTGDRVVQFNPRGPEDEEAAEQETDYVNFVVLERNNGFITLNSAIKDALLLRNGYIKCGWKVRQDVVLETYQGLSDEELALLTQDEDVEVVSHDEMLSAEMPIPGQPPAPPITVHDVKVRRVRPTEYVEIVPAPPDEIRVTQRQTEPSLQEADFVQHRTHKTISELREAGYDVDDAISDDEEGQTTEDFARQNFANPGDMWADPTQDPTRRMVLFKQSWVRVDYDGDGIAELREVCQVGVNLLKNEEADLVPIACFASILMPHRHLGVSVYDLVKDVAQIKTAVLRTYLDNRYLQNNAEKVVNIDAVPNIADFMESRPGGIKRVTGDPAAAVMPLIVPDTGAGALQSLEYLDSIRENRTGYTKTAAGLDPDSLATDTATGYMQQVSQSQLRLEMIARTIAETGMRDLFRIVHALTLKHSSKAEKVRLRNKWVEINPREWVRRTDLAISVGLGHTAGPQQAQALMMIGQAQQQAMPLGIVTPDNVFNTLTRLANASGFRNAEEFFTPPQKRPKVDPQTGQPVIGPDGKPEMESVTPPPPLPPQVQSAQIQAQTTMQAKQMDMQAEQGKMGAQFQLEQRKMEMDAAAKERDQQNALALQASNDQRDAMREQMQHERELQKMQMDDQFKRDQMAAQFQFDAAQKELDRQSQERLTMHTTQANVGAKQEGQKHMSALADMITKAMSKPKQVVRDQSGRVVGVVPVESGSKTVQ